MDNNIRAEIVKGTSKNGNSYTAVQFFIMTSQGEYASPLCFPTSLEISLIEKAISKFNTFYSEEN